MEGVGQTNSTCIGCALERQATLNEAPAKRASKAPTAPLQAARPAPPPPPPCPHPCPHPSPCPHLDARGRDDVAQVEVELAQELGEVVQQQQQHAQRALVQQAHLAGQGAGEGAGGPVSGLGLGGRGRLMQVLWRQVPRAAHMCTASRPTRQPASRLTASVSSALRRNGSRKRSWASSSCR